MRKRELEGGVFAVRLVDDHLRLLGEEGGVGGGEHRQYSKFYFSVKVASMVTK